MSHVQQRVHALHLHHVRLVVYEIGVFFDRVGHLVEIVALFQLDVNHPPVNARPGRNRHRQRGFNPVDRLDGYGVSHAHAGAEVRVGNPFRGAGFEQGAHHRVAARVPAGRHDRNGAVLRGRLAERRVLIGDLRMDVETVHRVDPFFEQFQRETLYAAARRAENRHVHLAERFDFGGYRIVFQFFGHVRGVAANDTGDFEVFGRLQRLEDVFSNVAISDDGCSDLFHLLLCYLFVK